MQMQACQLFAHDAGNVRLCPGGQSGNHLGRDRPSLRLYFEGPTALLSKQVGKTLVRFHMGIVLQSPHHTLPLLFGHGRTFACRRRRRNTGGQ